MSLCRSWMSALLDVQGCTTRTTLVRKARQQGLGKDLRWARTHSLGQRSFSYAAPAVWNTPPDEIRSSNTFSSSKSSLQTDLFSSPTDCVCWGARRGRESDGGREREGEREGGERERTSGVPQSVILYFVVVCLFVCLFFYLLCLMK